MTPALQSRLLALFGVPECEACHGEGRIDEGVMPSEPYYVSCPRCSGVGRTLLDATREGWPWWRRGDGTTCECGHNQGMHWHCEDRCSECFDTCWSFRPNNPTPYLPDFPCDDAAAVRLASVMSEFAYLLLRMSHEGWSIVWRWEHLHVGSTLEPTLGAALLTALESQS